MNARIYRLPHGDGFYVVLENNTAFLYDEGVTFEEALSITDGKDVWVDFIDDFSKFGIRGFGFGVSLKTGVDNDT